MRDEVALVVGACKCARVHAFAFLLYRCTAPHAVISTTVRCRALRCRSTEVAPSILATYSSQCTNAVRPVSQACPFPALAALLRGIPCGHLAPDQTTVRGLQQSAHPCVHDVHRGCTPLGRLHHLPSARPRSRCASAAAPPVLLVFLRYD